MPADPSDAALLSLCSRIERDINTAPDMPLMPSLDDVRVLIGAARRMVELRKQLADAELLLTRACQALELVGPAAIAYVPADWGDQCRAYAKKYFPEFVPPGAAGKECA